MVDKASDKGKKIFIYLDNDVIKVYNTLKLLIYNLLWNNYNLEFCCMSNYIDNIIIIKYLEIYLQFFEILKIKSTKWEIWVGVGYI